jgi:L-ascorbate metabolism protein UlaG (beta-lactamase superfamily)
VSGEMMEIQLIRSATLRIEYAQHKIVIDPYLAAKHSMPTYAGNSPNPIVDLPFPAEQVLMGIDTVIISHLHSDHFDATAKRLLSADMPIICQPGDDFELRKQGFQNVIGVADSFDLKSMKITRTFGQHGTGKVLQAMGNVSGFVFEADDEPTVYWAGDTIWCAEVAEVIDQVQPDIIITHSCGAKWDNALILMDAIQTVKVCQAASQSVVIATHMDAVDHATISRADLRAYATIMGIQAEQLCIPLDGEKLVFQ